MPGTVLWPLRVGRVPVEGARKERHQRGGAHELVGGAEAADGDEEALCLPDDVAAAGALVSVDHAGGCRDEHEQAERAGGVQRAVGVEDEVQGHGGMVLSSRRGYRSGATGWQTRRSLCAATPGQKTVVVRRCGSTSRRLSLRSFPSQRMPGTHWSASEKGVRLPDLGTRFS